MEVAVGVGGMAAADTEAEATQGEAAAAWGVAAEGDAVWAGAAEVAAWGVGPVPAAAEVVAASAAVRLVAVGLLEG